MCRITMLLLIAAAAVTFQAGCEGPGEKKEASEGTLLKVKVANPRQRKDPDYVEYTGRINAENTVTIQSRVTGMLKKIYFRDGQDVVKGQPLFDIDDEPYKAQKKAAEAGVKQTQASLDYAVATYDRFLELKKKDEKAVTPKELDQYKAQKEQGEANLLLAQANLELAEINLKYCKIYAPMDGRISRAFFKEGNLINQDATQLTTMVSMNPMFAYFDVDEPTLMRIKRAIEAGQMSPIKDGKNAVRMGLVGEEGYKHTGVIDFFDNQVNAGTGSISVRGIFPNPKIQGDSYLLLPGMFVRIQMPIGQPQEHLLVIDRVVQMEQEGKYLYVVDGDTVKKRRIKKQGQLQDDGLRVISEGLQPTDWVVIDQLQRLSDGMKVQAERWTMPSRTEPAKRLDK